LGFEASLSKKGRIMNQNEIKLEAGNVYHIYNRGVNEWPVFTSKNNKRHFLNKLREYVYPFAEVLAYSLLDNHFHLIIRVKVLNQRHELFKKDGLHSKQCQLSKQIGKCISSYTQSYNKVNKRSGALFESPFKRKVILNDNYISQAILYVMANPVHHGLVRRARDYEFCSTRDLYINSSENIELDFVLEHFGSRENLLITLKEFEEIENFRRFTNLEVDS